MRKSTVLRKINRRKTLINFLLKYLSPTNVIMVVLSQDLDKYIDIYQSYLARRYNNKAKSKVKAKKIKVA